MATLRGLLPGPDASGTRRSSVPSVRTAPRWPSGGQMSYWSDRSREAFGLGRVSPTSGEGSGGRADRVEPVGQVPDSRPLPADTVQPAGHLTARRPRWVLKPLGHGTLRRCDRRRSAVIPALLAMLLGACGGAPPDRDAGRYVTGFLTAAAADDWATAWTMLHPVTRTEMFDGDPAALAAFCDDQGFGHPWGSVTAVADDPTSGVSRWHTPRHAPSGMAGTVRSWPGPARRSAGSAQPAASSQQRL